MAKTIPLSVPDDLLEQVRETSRLTHLSVQDVFRQSVKIAAPTLRQSFQASRPRRLSVWDALHCGRGVELVIKPMAGKVEKVSL
jgi:hypothetical protein